VTDRLVIVADDLTGAADSAAAYGPFTEVAVALESSMGLPAADVVAVDTDSRHRAPEWAAAAVTAAVRAAAVTGAAVYKKIDSTLRGHVAVEVAAALRELSAGALVSPAFPGTGRTVIDGVLRVDGCPRGDLRALFAGSGLETALVPLEVVRRGVSAVVTAYHGHRARGAAVICADAVTDRDLAVLAAASAELGPAAVPVGSAGLTRAAVLHRPPSPRRNRPRNAGPVLIVVGSYSAVARQQREVLASSAEVRVVPLDSPFGAAEQRSAAADLAAAVGDMLLLPDPDVEVNPGRAAEVAAALSAVTGEFLRARHHELAGVVLTGGETARSVLLAAGVSRLSVLGELEPGVVLGSAPELGDLPLVTKAGAFGAPGTLDRACQALHRQQQVHDPSIGH
jgi:D-threonate/D-erythronate kinase